MHGGDASKIRRALSMALASIIITAVVISAVAGVYYVSTLSSTSTTEFSNTNGNITSSISTATALSSLHANSSQSSSRTSTDSSINFTTSSSTTTSTTSFTSTSSESTTVNVPNLVTTLNVSLSGLFAYNQFDKLIYVTSNHSIVEINATSNQIVGTIQLAQAPDGIVFDNVSNALYVSTTYYNANGNSPLGGLAELGVGIEYNVLYNQTGFSSYVGELAFNPSSNSIYLSNYYPTIVASSPSPTWHENITVIDGSTNRIVKNVTVGESSPGFDVGTILYDPYYGLLYGNFKSVGQDGGGGAVYYALNVTSFQVTDLNLPPNFPSHLAYNPSNGLVYVSRSWDCGVTGAYSCSTYPEGDISIIHGYDLTMAPIKIDSSPNESLNSIVYDSQKDNIYVANGTFTVGTGLYPNESSFNVSVVNETDGLVTSVLTFPSFVTCLLVNPDSNGQELYVGTSSEIYVISVV